MSRSRKTNHQLFSETGEKVAKIEKQSKEWRICRDINLAKKYINQWRIAKYKSKHQYGKQRLGSLKVYETTLAEDIDDFIDENEVHDECTLSEIECKVNNIEKLRTWYRVENRRGKQVRRNT